jgi:hypothetical protein
MESLPNESRVVLALQALKNDPKLLVRQASNIYSVSDRTLRRRRDSIPS